MHAMDLFWQRSCVKQGWGYAVLTSCCEHIWALHVILYCQFLQRAASNQPTCTNAVQNTICILQQAHAAAVASQVSSHHALQSVPTKRGIICCHGTKDSLHVSAHRSAFRRVIPFLNYNSQFALQKGSVALLVPLGYFEVFACCDLLPAQDAA